MRWFRGIYGYFLYLYMFFNVYYIFNMYGVCLLCDVLVLSNHYIGAVEPLKHFVLTCFTVPVLCMYQDGRCL